MSAPHDVAIVGSGPLAMAAARRLAERDARVLVLEQGSALTDPPGSHLRNSERFLVQPDSYLPEATQHLEFLDSTVDRTGLPGAAVTRTVGGQGVIWTNLCPRGDALWPAMSDPAWTERYQLAERYLKVQADKLDQSVRQQKLGAVLDAHAGVTGRTVADLPVAGHYGQDDRLRFTGSIDILNGGGSFDHVTIDEARVEKVVVRGDTIVGLETDAGTVEADAYVIAAGAIGTPQLLFWSGIRPDALGRYLSYHPLAVCQIVVDAEYCAPMGETDIAPRLQIRPNGEVAWYTILLQDVSPFTPTGADIDIASSRLVEIQSICPVDVDRDKRMIFDDHGHVTFDVPLSQADLDRMAKAEEEAHSIASAIGRIREGCEFSWMPFGFAHMTGTTRMSAVDDGTGVADYRGRVWGFENLYLATNGLIPTRMSVNPTLTGVSLAIHVADQITS
ncbi:MAG: GMC oxidoreductase [Pseudomonadota bacterium]